MQKENVESSVKQSVKAVTGSLVGQVLDIWSFKFTPVDMVIAVDTMHQYYALLSSRPQARTPTRSHAQPSARPPARTPTQAHAHASTRLDASYTILHIHLK